MNRVRETRFPGIVWCAALLAMACSARAWAGDNKYSKFEYDSQTGTGYFDLVVSVDWTPGQAGPDDKLNDALRKFAQTVFDATEGKHKLRKVRVYYADGEKGSCDIYISNGAGRANSTANGFGKSGARINMFTDTPEGSPRSATAIGVVLAHEFGHYAYGLFDEYLEAGIAFDTVPYMAHSNDVPCDCLMNSLGSSPEFCLEDYHSRATAQHRIHAGSCWTTLLRNPNDDPKKAIYKADLERRVYEGLVDPGAATQVQSGGDDAWDVIDVENSGAQVVIVLDRSGSMGTANKVELAKSAAKQFVDLMQIGDKIAVVSFDNLVETTWPMTELTVPPPQTDIKDAIDLLTARGSTAIGDAMRAALDIMSTQADPNLLRGVVLLSDGYHNAGIEPPQRVVPDYVAAKIPVFTVGLGPDVDEALLKDIAQQTGGTYYYSPTGAELQEIYANIAQATASNEQLLENFDDVLFEGNAFLYPFVADSSSENMTFLVSWNLGDTMRVELVTPNGTVITPENVTGFTDIAYAAELLYALYRVENPQPGTWMVRTTAQSVTSTGEINVRAQAVSDMQLSISLDSQSITYPTPLGIRAVLRKDLPITDAEVSVVVTTPDGSEVTLPLVDSGHGADDAASDGVYSGVFADYDQDGEYTIHVTALNPYLDAAETDSGLLEKGARSVWNPLNEEFKRAAEAVVTVMGVVSDDHGNTWDAATPIPSDNSDHPGRIETSYDLDFFSFTAAPGNSLVTVRITQLAGGMNPQLKVFGTDGVTLLADDTLDSAKSSNDYLYLEVPVTPNATYYASVNHTSAAAGGIYFISVGSGLASDRDKIPPRNVKSFAATGKDGYILLEWINPTDPDFAGVRIVRSLSGPPAGPNDGTLVYDGEKVQMQGEVDSRRKSNSFIDTQVSGDYTHYYAAFAYDTSMNYSPGVVAFASARSGEPASAQDTGCFVAKASYGTPLEKDINALRTLRDRYLLTNAPGAAFVCVYYSVSPAISHGIDGRPALLASVRLVLIPIVYFAKVFLAAPYAVLMLSLATLTLTLRKIIRRSRIVR